MQIKTLKQLKNLIHICKSTGVQHIEVDGISLTFDPNPALPEAPYCATEPIHLPVPTEPTPVEHIPIPTPTDPMQELESVKSNLGIILRSSGASPETVQLLATKIYAAKAGSK